MHYFSTVNLGIISKFTTIATAGICLSPSLIFLFPLMCIVGCIGHRPNETTSMFLSILWEQRALFCTHQPLSPPCWFLIFIFLIQHLALFNFPDKICWESPLLLNDLSLICLSLYVLCILDCAGSILDGINGLHSKCCSLSRLFCLYYWDGLLSVFFLDDLKL